MEAFRRLNYGKIPLTSTELVKALMLQGGDSMANGAHSRGAAYRRALEWDSMEHALHNPYLWAMLSDAGDNSLSHLELILDFVADRINEEMKDPESGLTPFTRKDKSVLDSKDSRDYFNYNVVNEYLRRKGDEGIELVWSRIRRTFNLITNWYDNRLWYHLIGLLRMLPVKRKSRREFLNFIHRMSVNSEGKPIDRPEFTLKLRTEIGNEARLPNGLELNMLSYNESKHRPLIIKILKLLNVTESISDYSEEHRFAFHLFEQFNVTSLEHIHPQNITTDAGYDDFYKWVNRRGEDFEQLHNTDFIGIVKNDHPDMAPDELKTIASELKAEIAKALATLRNLTATQKSYADKDNQEILERASRKLDRLFGELSGIKESELHSIANMALVDQPTNSALQNYFLDKKRDILMRRHNNYNTEPSDSTYAPPATRRVFSKDYSRKEPGDMRLWQKKDRTNYLNAITNAYNSFCNPIKP